MKLSEIKAELSLYGIASAGLLEKSEFTSALRKARDTLPRPSTAYREVGDADEPAAKSKSSVTSKSSAPSKPLAEAPAPTAQRLLARRSALTAVQQIREHPSQRVVAERSSSFLPGSPFSFSLKGSIFEADSAVLRIPDGVCLTLDSAGVGRKQMDDFLKQKGTVGVSLKISTEENPALLPIWTFDRERSTSYGVTNLGIRVAGPRTVRLMASMEMGFRSGAFVDVNVFGSVRLDGDKF